MMKTALKMLFTAAIVLWIGLVGAQQLEVIELKSKSVEDVLPVLLPLVEPGGTLTGMNNQLFLRASPRNRADIKKALAATGYANAAPDYPDQPEPAKRRQCTRRRGERAGCARQFASIQRAGPGLGYQECAWRKRRANGADR
jgi:hypothetical protein